MFTIQEIQRSFDEKNVQMLQEAMSRLHPEVRLLFSRSLQTKVTFERTTCYQSVGVHLSPFHRKESTTSSSVLTRDFGSLNRVKVMRKREMKRRKMENKMIRA